MVSVRDATLLRHFARGTGVDFLKGNQEVSMSTGPAAAPAHLICSPLTHSFHFNLQAGSKLDNTLRPKLRQE